MKLKALIFDFDGIITDTEPIHMEAWQQVLEPLGVFFDEEEYRQNYLGLNDRDFLSAVGALHRHHFSDAERADLMDLKCGASLELLKQEIPLLPGVADLIEKAKDEFMLSICSGAMRSEIEFILRNLRWTEYFSPIIAADSVAKGKPDPEGYIRTLEALAERASDVILAENVVAIEDSPKGIMAAKAAGMKCLAVCNSFSREDLSHADWILESLVELDLNALQFET